MESLEELCDHIALIHESEKIIEGPKNDIKQQFKTHTFKRKIPGRFGSLDGAFQVLETGKPDADLYHSRIPDHEWHEHK